MRTLTVLLLALSGSIGAIEPALAHAGHHHGTPALEWRLEWWVLLSIAMPIALYSVGTWRMHRRMGFGRIIGGSQIAAFAGGMLVLVIALVSPIDTVAEQLFSVHMIQHLLLLFVAPPLLVWSRPGIVFLWAFRSKSRHVIGCLWVGLGLDRTLRLLMRPQLVWVLFSGLFMFWHFPKPYAWALRNQGLHTIEHLCFFISALMFWTIVIAPSGRRPLSYATTLVHVATTALLGSLPGALIVLASRPLYPEHAAGAAAWGLTTMQDQQLAGVIMWVPAGLAYVAAFLWLFKNWLEDAERHELRRGRRAAGARAALLLVALASCGAAPRADAEPLKALSIPGDARRGRDLIARYGCGSCHVIPGVNNADGLVGPPLDRMGRRIYVAGFLRNTPSNLAAWIQKPQQIVPGNAMPDVGLTHDEARDMAAYLFTLQ